MLHSVPSSATLVPEGLDSADNFLHQNMLLGIKISHPVPTCKQAKGEHKNLPIMARLLKVFGILTSLSDKEMQPANVALIGANVANLGSQRGL